MSCVCGHHSDLDLKRTRQDRIDTKSDRTIMKSQQSRHKPVLFVDIDGVLSLFGMAPDALPEQASWHQVDGIAHLLSHAAAQHLLDLADVFDLVWCSGWEDRANEHLPHALSLGPFPYLTFAPEDAERCGHWKLAAIDAYAGERPLAWVDDDFNAACEAWADERRRLRAPTLLVATLAPTGLTGELAQRLRGWATAQGS
jgi:hypothetical protein